MSWFHRATVTLLAGMALMLAEPARAEPTISGLIEVSSFGVGGARVVTTIRNLTDAAIDSIRVEVWRGGGQPEGSVDRSGIPAKQSTVVVLDIPKLDETYVIVTARSGQVVTQLAVPTTSTPKAQASLSGPWPWLIPVLAAVLSFVGAMGGVFLTHFTTQAA